MLDRRALVSGLAGAACVGPALAQSLPGQRRFAAAFQLHDRIGGRGLVILRHGIVLGETRSAPAGEPADLGAATQALALILAAALAADGILRLDEPVALTLEGWAGHPLRQAITIRTLLDMTSGIALGLLPAEAQTNAEALRAEPLAAPGERFQPDAAAYQIFAEIARRKLVAHRGGEDVEAYLNRRVLARIGARTALSRDADGAPILSTGARMTLEGLGALGELIRRGGIHRAGQILSGAVLREANIGSVAEPRFGIGFWLGGAARAPGGIGLDLTAPDGAIPPDAMAAGGPDGNRLYIVPSASLVAARLGERPTQGLAWSDSAFLRALMSAV